MLCHKSLDNKYRLPKLTYSSGIAAISIYIEQIFKLLNRASPSGSQMM